MMKAARQSMPHSGRRRHIAPDHLAALPVDPIFRDSQKFELWGRFNGYTDGCGWELARIDDAAPYSPENCRWMQDGEQARITRAELLARNRGQNSPQKEALPPPSPGTTTAKTGRPRKMRCITRLWQIWKNMLRRCENPRCKDYPEYGDRGITVCEAWHQYQAFEAWAWEHGYSPELTLDRMDCDGGYGPDNCRWAGALEQTLNRRLYHGLYRNIRLTAADAVRLCQAMPAGAVVTVVVRADHIPDAAAIREADYPPVPMDERIDTVYPR